MITFEKRAVNENLLLETASNSFFECARTLYSDNLKSFKSTFEEYAITDLKTEVFKIHYTKYLDNEFLAFDGSTEFHFEVHLHVYAIDEFSDSEQLAVYRLILNENMKVVDDFLS